jgi:hypothetical protein
MPEGEFVHFHFDGGRFEASDGMPLEALGELALYRDLLVDVARQLWKRNHPERQRAPKKFGDELDLRLERVDSGSVQPIVGRREVESTLVGDYFDQSRDLITRTVFQVATKHALPGDFPRSQVPKLSRLGGLLNAGERYQFGHPTDTDRRAQLDVTTAAMLREIAETLTTEQPDTRTRGYIVEMDTDSSTFQIRAVDGRRIGGATYSTEAADEIRGWLVVDESDEALIEVSGTALVDAEGEVLRYSGVVSVREVHIEAVMAIFDALAQASAAADAAGSPIPEDHLRGLNERSELLGSHYPAVGLVAVDDGGIRIEWSSGNLDCSAEIDVDGAVFLHQFDMESSLDAEWEGHVAQAAWGRLDAFLRGESL